MHLMQCAHLSNLPECYPYLHTRTCRAVYMGPGNTHSALLPRTVRTVGLQITLIRDTLGHTYIRGSASCINCDLGI